jgi:hypothetical protein
VIIQLHNPQQGYAAYREAWPKIKDQLQAGKKINIEIKPATRSLEQNSRLWAMLSEISEQVDWYGRKLTEEEWKNVFTAALKKQEVVPGLDGGFVVLGQSTRNMTKAEMCDLQTLIEAFGAEKGVRFSA